MSTDQLILGGVTFDDWTTPEKIPFAGRHALKCLKLPGGSRVIHTLGPDEADVKWRGQIWRADAPAVVDAINGMRLSGQPVALRFAGNAYTVIVEEFVPVVVRYPQQYEYSISCLVTNNPMAGALGFVSSTFADLVTADMASALSAVGL